MTTESPSSARITFYEPLGDGGIAHYTYNLMNALYKKGADLCLVTNRRDELRNNRPGYPVFDVMFTMVGRLLAQFPALDGETPPYTVIRRILKLIEYPFDLLRVALILKRRGTQLMHIQTVNWIDILCILMLRVLNIPVVYTVHNINPLHGGMKWYHRFLFRLSYDICAHLIIHTRSGKVELSQLFGIPPDKISIIPHGDYKFFLTDEAPESDEAKLALGISPDAPTLLFFGAVRANKGLDLALEALVLARERSANVVLIVAGELCEDYATYRDVIDRNDLFRNVSEHFRYIPNEEVCRFFSAADVVVLPYREITQSGVLQVAYAFSKPVVAFALDGFKESVEHENNGLLAPPGDCQTFAKHIGTLISDTEKRKSFGIRSKILADRNYSWSEIADKTVRVYASCLCPTLSLRTSKRNE
jgi:glycosyltransferase involved in cell wall biosynthesis